MSGKNKKKARLEYFKHTARGTLIKAFDWYYVEGEIGFVSIKNGRKEKSKKRSSISVTDRILDVAFLENIIGYAVKYEYSGETVKGALIRESFSLRVLDLPKDEKILKKIIRKVPKSLRAPREKLLALKKMVKKSKPRRDMILCSSPMSVVGQGDAE